MQSVEVDIPILAFVWFKVHV